MKNIDDYFCEFVLNKKVKKFITYKHIVKITGKTHQSVSNLLMRHPRKAKNKPPQVKLEIAEVLLESVGSNFEEFLKYYQEPPSKKPKPIKKNKNTTKDLVSEGVVL